MDVVVAVDVREMLFEFVDSVVVVFVVSYASSGTAIFAH